MFFEASVFSPYQSIYRGKEEAFRVLCNSIFKKRCKLDVHVDTQEFQGTLKKLIEKPKLIASKLMTF